MKYTTRLCPTTSGPLHLGHLLCALVNATEAHASGGAFILRIDDTQAAWITRLGKARIEELTNQYIKELEVFMPIACVHIQSKLPDIHKIVSVPKHIWDLIPPAKFHHDQIPEWIPDRDMEMYPYAPMYTAEAVIWDYYAGVNWMIAGEDIVPRAGNYSFMVDMFKLPLVRQSYIPRLRGKNREPISKTKGNARLEYYLEKHHPKDIMEMLATSCLIEPNNGFFVNNVKWNPILCESLLSK